jgi:hypothetical protein
MGAENDQPVTEGGLASERITLAVQGEGELSLPDSLGKWLGAPSLCSGSRAKPQVSKTTMKVTRAFQSKYLEPSRAIGYFHNHPLEAFRNIHHHNLQQRGNSPPESNKNRTHSTVRMHCRPHNACAVTHSRSRSTIGQI